MCDHLAVFGKQIEKGLEELTEKMSQLSWQILETVPPLVSETISDAAFCKEWHEKELSPVWNKELKDYTLVYYRPVLFFSYEGKVSQKGWVGNTVTEEGTTAEEGHHRAYKKPRLKVKEIASSCSELAESDSTPQSAKEKTRCASINTEFSPEVASNSCLFGLRKY